ncbi:hypothetical protein ABMA32_05885 [Mesorhizobium sp. VNQ89]|uniref:hypothetical protein n=1 Tax=Mesorhizobium quangtriensis TaxID=3157709 RepID=UPI0032B70C6E
MRQVMYTTCCTLLAVAFGGSAHAQTSAVELNAVTNACLVSDAECQTAVTNYLTGLRSANLPTADYNRAVADLVVALATTANDDAECNDEDRRFATAISYSGTLSDDPAQAQLINDISDAVAACTEIRTAALTAEAASAN